MKNILLLVTTLIIFVSADAQWKLSIGNMPRFSPDLNLCFQSSGKQLGPNTIEYYLLQSQDYGITFQHVLTDTSNALFSRGYIIKNDSNVYVYAPFRAQIYHYKYPNYKQTDTITISYIANSLCGSCYTQSAYLLRFIPLFVNADTTIIILGKTWISTNKGTQKQFVPYNNHIFSIYNAGYYISPDYKHVAIAGRTHGNETKIFRSHDYGKTWVDSIPVPSFVSFAKFRNLDTIYAYDGTEVQKLYYSTDGGRNWAVKFDIRTAQGIISAKGRMIYEFQFTDLDHGILMLNGDTNIYSTINGGISWKSQTVDPPFEKINGMQEFPDDVKFVNDTLMYFTSSFYKTYRTGNAGGDVFVGVKPNMKTFENGLFSLFPNPTRKEFTIKYNRELDANLTYTISNTLGTILRQEKIKPGETKVNVSEFAKGIYFITVGFEVQKLVVE